MPRQLKPGDSVAVFWAGGVGPSAVMGAAAVGAAPSIAVALLQERLAKARERGATDRVNPYSLIGGKRLMGAWGGETRPDTDIPRYVEMFQDGRLPLDRFGTKQYRLEDVNHALDDLEAGRVVRAMTRMADWSARHRRCRTRDLRCINNVDTYGCVR